MNVELKRPPNWDDIVRVFPMVASPVNRVIFTWGYTIYNPFGAKIDDSLFAHEAVHSGRQRRGRTVDPLWWWDRYLEDPQFRLTEEIPAHRAEWHKIVETRGRAERRQALAQIAQRLAGPLYGRLLTANQAKELIL